MQLQYISLINGGGLQVDIFCFCSSHFWMAPLAFKSEAIALWMVKNWIHKIIDLNLGVIAVPVQGQDGQDWAWPKRKSPGNFIKVCIQQDRHFLLRRILLNITESWASIRGNATKESRLDYIHMRARLEEDQDYYDGLEPLKVSEAEMLSELVQSK